MSKKKKRGQKLKYEFKKKNYFERQKINQPTLEMIFSLDFSHQTTK